MDGDWKPEEHLGETIKIRIDRPMGSKHPKYDFIYPVNYGYVPGVISGDNEELDAFLLGVFEPVDEYEGRLIGVIYRDNDVEEKIVVAPKIYTSEQITALVEFQERWFVSWLAAVYDKPYWPDTFRIEMPEVKKAIEIAIEKGSYSVSYMQTKLEKGYGYVSKLCAWLEDNSIIEKTKNTKPRKLKVKTYEEAVKKIKEE